MRPFRLGQAAAPQNKPHVVPDRFFERAPLGNITVSAIHLRKPHALLHGAKCWFGYFNFSSVDAHFPAPFP